MSLHEDIKDLFERVLFLFRFIAQVSAALVVYYNIGSINVIKVMNSDHKSHDT